MDARSGWPSDLSHCHLLLEALTKQNAALRDTLSLAQKCVEELEQKAVATTTFEEDEVKQFLQKHRKLSLKESAVLLMMHDALPQELVRLKAALPKLCERLVALKKNDYDSKMHSRDKSKTQAWARRLDLVLHRQLVDILRARDSSCLFVLSLARSLAIQYQHAPQAVSRNLSHEGLLHDANTLNLIRAELVGWMPKVDFELTDEFVLVALDNLDMYSRRTHSRLKDGQLVKSEMVHALVSERLLFPKSLLHGPAPVGDLLVKSTESVVRHSSLPNRQTTEEFLTQQWKHFCANVAIADSPMDVLGPPPASFDEQTTGRTVCVSLPILTDRSTASKQDVTAAIAFLKAQFPGSKIAIVLDYQTFAVAWWIKARGGALYDDIIPLGGELHRQFHTDDCTYRLFWSYVLEPAALWLCRTDIRQPFNADKYNNKESFKRMVAVSVFMWLQQLQGEAPTSLDNPCALLKATENNLPVWELLSFQFYCGVFALSDKMAMRTGRVSELDFAWGYCSILARACGKTNYAKYGVLMNLVLHSSHQWVRDILSQHRTYRMTDTPCTGQGLEAAIEKAVRETKSGVSIPSSHRLSAVNVAMTAMRENRAAYEQYIGVSSHRKRSAVNVEEDIQLLVDQFNLAFGTTWDEVTSTTNWSKFANLGVKKKECGGYLINQVWHGIPNWLHNLTVSTVEQPIPLIFEPPDVDDCEFYDLENANDDDACLHDDGLDEVASVPGEGSWAQRAAAQWMRTHDSDSKKHDEDRLEQLIKIFERSSRRQNLYEKKCREAAEADAAEAAVAIAVVQSNEEHELDVIEHEDEVQGIVGKRVEHDVTYYRIRWRGYGHKSDTYEPVSQLSGCEMLITAFEEKFKTCKRPNVSVDDYTPTGRKRKKKK